MLLAALSTANGTNLLCTILLFATIIAFVVGLAGALGLAGDRLGVGNSRFSGLIVFVILLIAYILFCNGG